MADERLTYDTAYAELEAIMRDLQEDRIGVDELTAKVRRAVELVAFCNALLRSTEEEVERIVKQLGQG
ncbi:MAG: exodeoxyribonuclease VII small subunit [Flavobacteriales bacterium]|jgi:exodeoxyribonuclease VII small subunit|nr:exodeoxyribonuclease VII small subunit [Flavobacteriales bacterium]MBK7943137.1 exodeoxyribonuclease VII small subunit [Flavobacteriales bacterium]MBK8947363.1 exodeoxyribonuclease VII small subunit [Flavobacteriales bacterium]MBK9701810.1 exodeoxyribonuclease VII small subunit [Flavobacteriales bacterium]